MGWGARKSGAHDYQYDIDPTLAFRGVPISTATANCSEVVRDLKGLSLAREPSDYPPTRRTRPPTPIRSRARRTVGRAGGGGARCSGSGMYGPARSHANSRALPGRSHQIRPVGLHTHRPNARVQPGGRHSPAEATVACQWGHLPSPIHLSATTRGRRIPIISETAPSCERTSIAPAAGAQRFAGLTPTASSPTAQIAVKATPTTCFHRDQDFACPPATAAKARTTDSPATRYRQTVTSMRSNPMHDGFRVYAARHSAPSSPHLSTRAPFIRLMSFIS